MTRGVREEAAEREQRMEKAAQRVMRYMRSQPNRDRFAKEELIEVADIKDYEWRDLRDTLAQMDGYNFTFKAGPGGGWSLWEV